MPASDRCAKAAEPTDEEFVSIHRTASAHKTGHGTVFDFGDGCPFAKGHKGDCAEYIASFVGRPVSAWIRWSDAVRRLDWLPDCPVDGCALFLGHPGDCDPCGIPDGDRRWANRGH